MAENHHGDLTRETFPLPSLAPRIAEWNRTLSDGHGFLLVHGFPVDELDDADIETVVRGEEHRRPAEPSPLAE